MKKRMIIICCVLLASVIAIGLFLGWLHYHKENYIYINGERYHRAETHIDLYGQKNPDLLSICQMEQLQRLDMRGTEISAEDYQLLCSALPECNILWDIPFQGSFYNMGTTNLTVTELFDGDLDVLTCFSKLLDLDLRGTGITVADYETLHAALPECCILWDIPFQGGFYSMDTAKLVVTELSDQDLDTLAYFSKLQEVDALGCRDYDSILELQARYPDCDISYQITAGGEQYRESTTSLSLKDVDTGELELALACLPNLESIHLTGALPEATWISNAILKYPNVNLTWEYTLLGRVFPRNATEIDLSNIHMDNTDAIESALPYFPELTKVVMCNCGIPSEEMDALNKRYEDIRFVWSVRVGRCELRTDATVFMPFKWGYTPKNPLENSEFAELKYCTDIICMDLGHMRVYDISFLNYMPNMQYLMLADTLVSDITPIGTLKELVYLELFLTRIRDISPLLNCTKLEDLNMSWTKPENLEVLKDMSNLKNLWLVNTTCPYQTLSDLQNSLPDTRFIAVAGGSSTDYGWRNLPNYYAQRDLLGMKYMVG